MTLSKSALKRKIGRARRWDREEKWDDEAVDLNTEILEASPDRIGAYLRSGRCYMYMGLHAEAEEDFDELYEIEEEEPDEVGQVITGDHILNLVSSVDAALLARVISLPESSYSGQGSHSVYVIELDPGVLDRRKFIDANPDYVPGRPCVYVGLTGLSPEERFDNHKAGHKANRYARNFGLRLLPEFYEHFKLLSHDDAVYVEVDLAETLRSCGFAVWSN